LVEEANRQLTALGGRETKQPVKQPAKATTPAPRIAGKRRIGGATIAGVQTWPG
jgi:hypothetical protein